MIKFVKQISIENLVCSGGHRFDIYWHNSMQIGLESLVIQPKDLQGDLLFCKVIQSEFFINDFPPYC
jgi:hypothetical protein